MSSAGSPIFCSEWIEHWDFYRIFESDHPDITVALLYQWIVNGKPGFWIFDPVFCSDDFRPPVSFVSGPLAGQHSYPLDITVLTDTLEEIPF